MTNADPAERFTAIERWLPQLREEIASRQWLRALDTSRFMRGLHREFEAACENLHELQTKQERRR